MTEHLGQAGAPDSIQLLIHALRGRRRLLLGLWLVGICVVALLCYSLGLSTLVIMLIPVAGALIILYGGGPLAPLPSSWSRRLGPLPRLRLWGWCRRHPRLMGCARWLIPLPCISLLFGVALTLMGMLFLIVTVRLGGYGLDRDLARGFLAEIEVAGVVFFGAFLLSLFLGVLFAILAPRIRALGWMTVMGGTVSLYCFMLFGIVLYVHAGSLSDLEGSEIVIALSFAFLPFLAFCGIGVRLLFLSPPSAARDTTETLVEPQKPVEGDANLSTARTFAAILLVVCYVSLDVSLVNAEQMELLQKSRRLFAARLLEDYGPDQTEELLANEQIQLIGMITVHAETEPGLFVSTTRSVVQVDRIDGSRWTASPSEEDDLDRHLRDTAIWVQLDVEPGESFYHLFGRVANKLEHQNRVSIPLIGLPVEASTAGWALVLVTFMLLVLIRSRLRRVFVDPDLAIKQPWLILDARTRLERWTARVWLAAVVTSPWLVSAMLVLTLAFKIPAEGGVTSVAEDVLTIGLLLVFFVASASTAALTVVDLRELRNRRWAHLRSPLPKPDER